MSIFYRMDEVQDNMNPENEKKKGLFPRVISTGTIFSKELIERATANTTISPVEAQASFNLIVQQMIDELKDGKNVCFEDFGMFSLTAKSRLVQSEDEIRGTSIEVSKLSFRMSKNFLRRLGLVEFVRLPKRLDKKKQLREKENEQKT